MSRETVVELPDAAAMPPIAGRVRFEGVSFAYDTKLVFRALDGGREPTQPAEAVVEPAVGERRRHEPVLSSWLRFQ